MPASKKRKQQRIQKSDDTSLHSVSTADLQNEIFKRESKLALLIKKRDRFLKRAERLNAQIQQGIEMPNSPKEKAVKTEAANSNGSLLVTLTTVLQGKKMKLAEMEKAVKETGYKTKSKDFSNVIYQCIKDHRSNFRRVSRGVYTAKSAASKGE
jgi:hypothetical protein